MAKNRKGYSVKRGRTRSAQGVAGGIFGMIFGIIWTVGALSVGAPWFFGLFGICFVAMIGYNTYISYKNATGENRYSEFDIVDMESEPDPWDEKFRGDSREFNINQDCGHIHEVGAEIKETTNFCPYCGAKTEPDFEFCKFCGRQLPD